MPSPLTVGAIGFSAHLVDPLQLSTYLAHHGWHYGGLKPGSSAIISWHHRDRPVAVTVHLDLHDPAADLLNTQALAVMAEAEQRIPAAVIADLTRSSARGTGPNGWPGVARHPRTTPVPAGEQQLRSDYLAFRTLLYHPVTGALDPDPPAQAVRRACQLEDRWLPISSHWHQLHTTVEAWRNNPATMDRLHKVLLKHPASTSATTLRDHDQARALTGHPRPAELDDPALTAADLAATATRGHPNHPARTAAECEQPESLLENPSATTELDTAATL